MQHFGFIHLQSQCPWKKVRTSHESVKIAMESWEIKSVVLLVNMKLKVIFWILGKNIGKRHLNFIL